MKKFLTLGVAAALALGFAACSSEDEPVPGTASEEHNGSESYLQLTFTFPTSTSRADAYDSGKAESTGDYTIGQSYEYNIDSVFLYFFHENVAEGTGAKTYELVKFDGKAYKGYSVVRGDANATTSETPTAPDGSAATWKTAIHQLPGGIYEDETYHVYALCNKPYTGTVESEADLLDSKMDFDSTDIEREVYDTTNGLERVKTAKIPMTARSSAGVVYATLKATKANNITNPFALNFDVERSYARIAFMDTDFTKPVYKSSDATTPIAFVSLQAYQVVNKNKVLYTYRHVGTISDAFAVGDWNKTADATTGILPCYGPMTATLPYVIDPITKDKNNTTSVASLQSSFINPLAKITSPTWTDDSGTDAFATRFDGKWIQANTPWHMLVEANEVDGEKVPVSIEYVAENTMQTKAQIKGQTTGIIFMVNFGFTGKNENGTAVDCSANLIQDKFSTRRSWHTGDDLYYVDGKFYASMEDLQASKNSSITQENMSEYGVRYFKHGVAYYEYYIRHLDNGDNTEMGQMEFAIVRNNSYELSVKKITMSPYSQLPGNPDPDNPDPDKPDPDDPDESAKVYIQMNVQVRPWIIRTNAMSLGH
jgi:hypothetical protein